MTPFVNAPRSRRPAASACVAALVSALCLPAAAQVSLAGGTGKLLLTGGVSSIDGAAGGGLTPWAVTGSYASEGQFGATVFGTRWQSRDYTLVDTGIAVSWSERLELSLARQDFDTHEVVAPLGFPGLRLKQTIVGAKWRVAGDAVLDSDTLMPAIAVGVLHKRLDTLDSFKAVLASLGARDSGTDLYVSATKLLLAQSTLVNLTLRATKANQNGLLGFGSTQHDRYRLQREVSLAYLFSKHVALGVEYRAKPDNLNPSPFGDGLAEDDWSDVFLVWAPVKNLSLTAAYVDLGKIVPALAPKRQRGSYVSAQLAF